MVQSLDLVRISTVQSTDFLGQSSDLAEDLSKSSNGSEEFIYFVWVLICQSIEDAFYTTSPLTDWDLQMVFLRSPLRTQLDLNRLGWTQTVRFLYFLFYSSNHEILHGFGVKSSDFLVNPWVNPQIVWISLNPWIYRIYLRIFKFSVLIYHKSELLI